MMTDEELDAEHRALLSEQAALESEHQDLEKYPFEPIAHRAHLARLRKHIERLHLHLNRLKDRAHT
jgi:hypothetical protein